MCVYIYKYAYCDGLSNFLTFVQFKKREKHPWSVTFSKVAG